MFTGPDTSPKGVIATLNVAFPQTTFLVDAVRLTIDNSADPLVWEQIDAVQLCGSTLGPPLGISVTPALGSTSESGGSTTFTVVLDTVPTGSVTIPLNSSDVTEGTVSPASHTFTLGNALTPQTVTVTGVDDALIDGNITYTIVTGPATSADPDYNNLTAPGVAVVNLDNDLSQPATSVIAFSSQFGPGSYSAAQTLGPANVSTYGDSINSWSPSVADGTTELLTLGFSTPVFASGVVVRESWGNGFVTAIEVRNLSSGTFVNVFSGVDTSPQGSVVDFLVNFTQTAFLVDAIRVTIDTNHSTVWEEVDSVQLHGLPPSPRPLNEPGRRDVAPADQSHSRLTVPPDSVYFNSVVAGPQQSSLESLLDKPEKPNQLSERASEKPSFRWTSASRQTTTTYCKNHVPQIKDPLNCCSVTERR